MTNAIHRGMPNVRNPHVLLDAGKVTSAKLRRGAQLCKKLLMALVMMPLLAFAERGLYMVVDLSGGTKVSAYPISYLDSVPTGGWTDEYKTTKLVLRWIEPGSFTMGSPENEVGRVYNSSFFEKQHVVSMSKGFYIGVFELTQRQWELVMGSRPSYFSKDTEYGKRPVESVPRRIVRGDWNTYQSQESVVDPQSFLGILGSRANVPCDLPTEAEWEYACRAGTDTALNSGRNLSSEEEDESMGAVGRYLYNGGENSDCGCSTAHGTATVGSYVANNWGLYDMHGNVSEFVRDVFDYGIGRRNDVTDPIFPLSAYSPSVDSGDYLVNKGGAWSNPAGRCRSSFVNAGGDLDGASSSSVSSAVGFRIVVADMNCEVTFNANGGEGSMQRKTYSYGSRFGTLPAVTRAGYAFDGWFTAKSEGDRITESTTVTGDMALFAHWRQNLVWPSSYRTDFCAGDLNLRLGIPVVMDPGMASGVQRLYEQLTWDDYTAPECPYVRGGYRFVGWEYYSCCYIGLSGHLPFYCKGEWCGGFVGIRQPGDTIDVCGLSALVATWEVDGVSIKTVEFDANGGDVEFNSRIVEKGKSVGSLPTPVWSKHKFLGWYTMPDGGKQVSASTKVTENVTYYAHWRFDGSTAVVVRVAEECEGMGTISGGNKTFKVGAKVTLKATAKKGAAFANWYDEERGVVSMSSSYSFVASGEDTRLTAYFVKAEDDWLEVADDGCQRSDIGEFVNEKCLLSVASGSAATVTIKGLPLGVKATVHNEGGEIWVTGSGVTKKEGVYWLTCSAKNGNGYHASATIKWVVGQPKDTDYNNVGLDLEAFENKMETGREFYWNNNGGAIPCGGGELGGSITKITVSGLPSGLKLQTATGYGMTWWEVVGRPAKAGKFVVTFTATYANKKTAKAVKTILVRDSGSRYLHVKLGEGQEGRGTVTGSGVCIVGEKVKVTAKAAKGYYFAGWYLDPGFKDRAYMDSGEWRKASDRFQTTAEETDDTDCLPTLYAKFVMKGEDAEIGLEFLGEVDEDEDAVTWFVSGYAMPDASYFDVCSFDVCSETMPTVTVRGLPSGCKWDKKTNKLIFEKQPTKPGVTKATITAKNLSGATMTRTLYVKVPNLRSEVFHGIDYESDYHLIQGVALGLCQVKMNIFEIEAGWNVTASGLPSGLKFEFAKEWGEHGESGGFIYGTPTKAGVYTVVLTAKRSGDTQKATVTFVVDALPNYVIGRFSGLLKNDGDCVGTFSLTATAAGKLSASLIMNDGTKKSYSASSWSCAEDGVFSGSFSSKKGDEWVWFGVDLDLGWEVNQLHGEFLIDQCRNHACYCIEGEIVAQRNPFGKIGNEYENPEAHEIAAKLSEYGKMNVFVDGRGGQEYDFVYPDCDPAACGIKPDLTFSVSTDGTVKVAGKIAGKSISGSTTLRIIDGEPQADFCLLASKMVISIHADFDMNCGAYAGIVSGSATVGYGY